MSRDSIFTVSPGLSFAEKRAPGFGLAKGRQGSLKMRYVYSNFTPSLSQIRT